MMFQQITFNDIDGSYTVYDSNFSEVCHPESNGYVGAIIECYSRRCLNVLKALKLYVQSFNRHERRLKLEDIFNYYHWNYYDYNFIQYYKCLKHHIDKLNWIGK